MSDHDHEPLGPEAQAFLSEHQQTGEPSALELSAGAVSLRGRLASARRPTARRRVFPPELLAVAAVLVLVVAGRGLYVLLKGPSSNPTLSAAREAWRAGDAEGAALALPAACDDAPCTQLRTSLARARTLVSRIDTLEPGEVDELEALDAELSQGVPGEVALRLTERKAGPKRGEQLFEQANVLRKARHYEAAIVVLESCVQQWPSFPACYRLQGSVFASIAARDSDAQARESARAAYQRFLEVASPTDEYFPKVTAILEQARGDAPAAASAQLTVGVGAHAEVSFDQDITRVAVGDSSIADVKVLGPGKLELTGVSAGSTSLLVWFKGGGQKMQTVEVR